MRMTIGFLVAVAIPVFLSGDGVLALQEERNPVPTVDDCVERTGKSETECSEMIKMMPSRRAAPSPDRGSEENLESGNPIGIPAGRSVSLRRFASVTDRLKDIVRILRESGVDVKVAEESIGVFSRKSEEADRALDALSSVRDGTDEAAFEAARESARTALEESMRFYRNARDRLTEGIQSMDLGMNP
jgi:hypothetical protein